MNKKKAIAIVVIVEILVYLFILLVLPILNSAIFCPECNARELFAPPLMLYTVPGLIGIIFIVLIWKQKEVKGDA